MRTCMVCKEEKEDGEISIVFVEIDEVVCLDCARKINCFPEVEDTDFGEFYD